MKTSHGLPDYSSARARFTDYPTNVITDSIADSKSGRRFYLLKP
ncbi:hypothetical protein [Rhodoflexus sp.]